MFSLAIMHHASRPAYSVRLHDPPTMIEVDLLGILTRLQSYFDMAAGNR